MSRAEWTPDAKRDIDEIAYYIAIKDGRPQVARKNIEAIIAKAAAFADMPEAGQTHQALPKGSRYRRHKRWAIVYEQRDFGIVVTRVVDCSRDFPRLFGKE